MFVRQTAPFLPPGVLTLGDWRRSGRKKYIGDNPPGGTLIPLPCTFDPLRNAWFAGSIPCIPPVIQPVLPAPIGITPIGITPLPSSRIRPPVLIGPPPTAAQCMKNCEASCARQSRLQGLGRYVRASWVRQSRLNGLGAAAAAAASTGGVDMVRPGRGDRGVTINAGSTECDLANPPAGKKWQYVGPGACDYQLVTTATTPAANAATPASVTFVGVQTNADGSVYYKYSDGSKELVAGPWTPQPSQTPATAAPAQAAAAAPATTPAGASIAGILQTGYGGVPLWGWLLGAGIAYQMLGKR